MLYLYTLCPKEGQSAKTLAVIHLFIKGGRKRKLTIMPAQEAPPTVNSSQLHPRDDSHHLQLILPIKFQNMYKCTDECPITNTKHNKET